MTNAVAPIAIENRNVDRGGRTDGALFNARADRDSTRDARIGRHGP
jgi:hypothetical protein